MQNGSVRAELSSQCSLRVYLTEGIKFLITKARTQVDRQCTSPVFGRDCSRVGRPADRLWRSEKLGWNRGTIRKGMHEVTAGVECIDAFCLRGRKRSEKHLPNLLDDIRDIVDSNAQVDATLRTPRLYVKLTARQVRTQLIKQKDYKDEDLPKRRTISTILNRLGYQLRKVKKTDR